MSRQMSEKDVQMLQWVRRCEDSFANAMEQVAECIFEQKGLHVVLLTGPTCSGKTTTANLLESYFRERGRRIIPVSIDDFYYDREQLDLISKQKGLEDMDYESVETLDLDALRQFTEEMIHAEEIHSPVFDFSIGRRSGYRTIRFS